MKKFQRSRCPATIGFKTSGQAVIVFCGQWSCPTCAKKLARKWAIRTFRHIEAEMAKDGKQWSFLTLTLSGYYTSTAQGYNALKHLWDALRQYIKRHFGRVQYCAFVEGQPHRAGMPHFHILLSITIVDLLDKKGVIRPHRVHKFAVTHGFGHQASYSKVESREAASYVSKYASKGTATTPKGFRHVRTSRNWYKLPKKEALIVPKGGEDVASFIDRVSSRTGLPHEDIYSRYAEIWQEYERLQTFDKPSTKN